MEWMDAWLDGYINACPTGNKNTILDAVPVSYMCIVGFQLQWALELSSATPSHFLLSRFPRQKNTVSTNYCRYTKSRTSGTLGK